MDRSNSMLLFMAALCLGTIAGASATGYMTQLTVFGDSISDTGLGALLGCCGPPAPEYWAPGTYVERGGMNWVQALARRAGLSDSEVENYAIGGATMCPSPGNSPAGVSDEVSLWIRTPQSQVRGNGHRVTFVMLGTNDWFGWLGSKARGATNETVVQHANRLAACLEEGLKSIAAAPAMRQGTVYVAYLEALEHIPLVQEMLQSFPEGFDLDAVVELTNVKFNEVVSRLAPKLAREHRVKVASIDITAAYRRGFAQPPPPIRNLTGACLVRDEAGNYTVCAEPRTYAFFDNVHYNSVLQTQALAPPIISRLIKDKLLPRRA